MTALSILTLSVGLAMDAMAVAAARGFAAPSLRARDVLRISLFFGGFQAFMPLCGWYVGAVFGSLVSAWDHWIAFALLGAIGAKMLWEARPTRLGGREPESKAPGCVGRRAVRAASAGGVGDRHQHRCPRGRHHA